MEFKILSHFSQFTNDLVEKDFLHNKQNLKFLPSLKVSSKTLHQNSHLAADHQNFENRSKIFFIFFYFLESSNKNDSSKVHKNLNDSYFSESETRRNKNNLKLKKSNMFGSERKDLDKFFVYKRMEDLNNLEHKFHQDKDDKIVTNHKFNHRYHNLKRQL